MLAIPSAILPSHFFESQLDQYHSEISHCQAIWVLESYYSLVIEMRSQSAADRVYNVSRIITLRPWLGLQWTVLQ